MKRASEIAEDLTGLKAARSQLHPYADDPRVKRLDPTRLILLGGQDPDSIKCWTCMDTGVIGKDVEVGDPDFGKALPCPGCKVAGKAKDQDVLISAGVPREWANLTLRTFRDAMVSECQREVYRLCVELAQDPSAFREAHGRTGLFLWGSTGVGKTGPVIGVMRVLLYQVAGVRMIHWGAWIRELQGTFGEDSAVDVTFLVKAVARPYLLVIDEFGGTGVQTSQWRPGIARELMDERHRRAQDGAITIVTSNLDLAGIEREFGTVVGPAVVSRLEGMCVPFEVDGPDLRVRAKV